MSWLEDLVRVVVAAQKVRMASAVSRPSSVCFGWKTNFVDVPCTVRTCRCPYLGCVLAAFLDRPVGVVTETLMLGPLGRIRKVLPYWHRTNVGHGIVCSIRCGHWYVS